MRASQKTAQLTVGFGRRDRGTITWVQMLLGRPEIYTVILALSVITLRRPKRRLTLD